MLRRSGRHADWRPTSQKISFLDMKLDELALMVSEVVSNAVRHGSPEADGNIGLRLEGDQDALRVVVTDGGEDFAFDPESVKVARNGHFGLLFVDRLADRWGLSLDGKTAVWLEVDTPVHSPTLAHGSLTARPQPSPKWRPAQRRSW
jgi:anti-sigma regulatory factor (Ser/Thr protein kinase)